MFVAGDAGGNGPWFNDSDVRLKKNIHTIENPLDKVSKLRGVNFEWKYTKNHEDGKQIGFIAQESLEIIPEVVSKKDEYYSMQYAPITALLVEAVKELNRENSLVKAENEMLKEKLVAMEARQNVIETMLLAASSFKNEEIVKPVSFRKK